MIPVSFSFFLCLFLYFSFLCYVMLCYVIYFVSVDGIILYNQSIIPSTDVMQLTLTLKMTTAQVVETSVTVDNKSPIQDYVHPDDQTQPFVIYFVIINFCKNCFPSIVLFIIYYYYYYKYSYLIN